jgi:hypothetical protein
MYALKMLSSILSSMLSSMFPIAWHDTLPSCLALCFQVYSQEARYSQFHLTICSHRRFLVLIRDLKSCSHQAPGGRAWVVGSRGHIVAEIITSINIKVWTISLLCPPQWDLAMLHSYSIDNCNFRFSRKSRKLDHRTQMF